MRPKTIVLLTALLVVSMTLSCRTSALPPREPDIRGVITDLDRELPPRWILVEENPDDTTGTAKAHLRLGFRTRVFRTLPDGSASSADALALIRGEKVVAWFTDGVAAESYPVQARAEAVLIETHVRWSGRQ